LFSLHTYVDAAGMVSSETEKKGYFTGENFNSYFSLKPSKHWMPFNIVFDHVYQNSLSNRLSLAFQRLYNHMHPFVVSPKVFGMLFPGAFTKQ
jgi:hypothetical protein